MDNYWETILNPRLGALFGFGYLDDWLTTFINLFLGGILRETQQL